MVKIASLHVLPDKQAYKDVFSNNNYKLANSYFLLLVRPGKQNGQCSDTDAPYSRLGLVIGRRNVHKASQRNTIKRVVRETFRLSVNKAESLAKNHMIHSDPPIGEAFDCVFLARSGITALNKKELAAVLNKAWLKVIARYR